MNLRNTIIAILAALSASLALAQNFQTINGKEYKNASVIHVEPDGITIKFSGGITNQEIQEANKRAEVEKQKVEAEKRKALEVSRPAQSAEGVSRQNTANGPHIVGVGGVDGVTVEMGDKHLQLHAAAMEEAQTPQEKAARYETTLKKYEGAKQVAARRGLNSNKIVPPRYGQLYYDPFANVDR
jgi:methionine-rich copper-binding protein CopC